MNKLFYKLAAGITTAGVATLVMASTAFAGDTISCTIKNNGAFSKNTCIILVGKKTPPPAPSLQLNNAKIFTGVVGVAATGGNTIIGTVNTGGGDTKVDSGNATVTVVVTNNVTQSNP